MTGRKGQKYASIIMAHITLLCGAGIFLFPFVWMVGMSLKTDEEATSTQLFPAIPAFRAESPYVSDAPDVFSPPGATPAQWARLVPLVQKRVEASMLKLPLPAGAQEVSPDTLRAAAAREVAMNLGTRLDQSAWAGSDEQIVNACAGLQSDPENTAALKDRLGRLDLSGLQIRDMHGSIYRICDGDDVGKYWKVESGPGRLMPAGTDGCYLSYHFAPGDDAPIVLRCDFPSPVKIEDLQRLIVSINADDSWHRIDASLQLGTTQWESALDFYIAQHRAAALLLQPPGFADDSYMPRLWIPLNAVKPEPGTARSATDATLRLIIRPSSVWRAVYGKVQRNYERAFRSVPFWTYVQNSLILVVLQIAGALLSTSFVAYAFARLNWPGRGVALAILLSTMMLPSQVTIVPSFLIWKALGWYNTLNPLWVGAWFGNAFFIFLMIQFIKTIPKELDEAARIDGLNAVQTWWYVILPQLKPPLAAIAIMTFMGAWNDFMGPLIMLRDQRLFPLSLGIFGMRTDQGGDWAMIMAGNMLMVLPVIVIFFLFQRYFIEGVTVTGIKG